VNAGFDLTGKNIAKCGRVSRKYGEVESMSRDVGELLQDLGVQHGSVVQVGVFMPFQKLDTLQHFHIVSHAMCRQSHGFLLKNLIFNPYVWMILFPSSNYNYNSSTPHIGYSLLPHQSECGIVVPPDRLPRGDGCQLVYFL
jgi:hypothetical protein